MPAMPAPARKPAAARARAARKPRQAYHHGDLRNAAVAEAVGLIGQARDADFTLRDLAARLRVTSTALYRHFPGKRALLAAVAEEGFRALGEACARHEALLESDPAACFREQGLEYVRFALRNPGHFRVMFSPELARAKDELPALRAAGQASYQQLKRALTACQAQGLLGGFDLDTIALTAWSTVHGIATLLLDGLVKLDEPGSASEEQLLGVAGQVIRVMGYGALLPQEGRSQPG
jgi:AcrR family transcriptional regulator